MSCVTVYMEGGGDFKDQKAQLRQGMDRLLVALKDKTHAKNWKWRLAPCGGRQAAYEAFLNARMRPAAGEIIILLVDSESPVTAASRAVHLRDQPGDGWDLTGVSEDHIHFMVQAMEAWIVADPEALSAYYGQHFQKNALPKRNNLEEEPKVDCANKLAAATRPTQKGEYQKIRHAAELLTKISPDKVRNRCPHAEILFSTLSRLIG